MDSIIVPGKGFTNSAALAVDKAVNEYDERLRFGYNETNEDWIVYVRMPRSFQAAYYVDGEPIYPVLGFGPHIPHPEDAIKRLVASDTLRATKPIIDKINEDNIKLRASGEEIMAAVAQETAEKIEHALRQAGERPQHKFFF